MNTCKRHRFPPDIISYTVWLYYRFTLSHRRCAGPFIEDLLPERGITVSYETIRLWCIKFGSLYAGRLKRKYQGYGDTFYIDEVFVKINGKQHYLWRAVDQDGDVVDVYLQARRDGADYCGVGPMFPTTTKPKKVIPGPDYLREFLAWGQCPHLAIGGIGLDNISQLVEVGAVGIAVSSCIYTSYDPKAVCRQLLEALGDQPDQAHTQLDYKPTNV